MMNDLTLPDTDSHEDSPVTHLESPSSTGTLAIRNARILLPDGWRDDVTLVIERGVIQELTQTHVQTDREIDARGRAILPGLVDIHGDAFEREIAPRAGVQFDLDLAFLSNDANLISAGITTFYYSITDGYEPGLRSRDSVRNILDCLDRLHPRLKCNSRIHLRHELANIRDHQELIDWMKKGRVHLLSLNNHLPHPENEKAVAKFITSMGRREKMPDDQVRQFMMDLQKHIPEGRRQSADLAQLANALRIPLASHDDKTDEDVARAIDYGVRIAEFPLTEEALCQLKEQEIQILMGAPNGVRGTSHVSGTSVREEVRNGHVDILCSDYHYPSLLRIPFLLAEHEILPLEEAYQLVSANPARAVGLGNRKGTLAPGMDADLLILQDPKGHLADLDLVMVSGKPVLNRGIDIC